MSVEYSIKHPQTEVAAYSDFAFLLMNPTGSSHEEDTGREAQEMADEYGVKVVAADRPAGDSHWPDKSVRDALSTAPIKAMEPLGKKLDREFDNLGIKRVRYAGRSAAATGLLELAQTELISASDSMYVAEAPGWYDIPLAIAAKTYKVRLKEQRMLEKADKDQAKESGVEEYTYPIKDYATLPRRQQAHRIASMLLLGPLDVYYNRNHYNKNIVPDYLAHVLDLGLRTHLDSAEKSLVLPKDETLLAATHAQLDELRSTHNDLFTYRTVQNTLHRSFDLRPFFFKLAWEAPGAIAPRASN